MHEEVATTPTQYALGIGVLLVAPVLASFAAAFERRRGGRPWRAAALVGIASWSGWLVSGIAAASLFPQYPRQPEPSEPIALLFTLPGLAAGGLALAWLIGRRPRPRPSSGREKVVLGIVVVFAVSLAVAMVSVHVALTRWPGRRHLPSGADVVHERALADSFLGDFEYVLRARMCEEDFREWMRRLDVPPTDDPAHFGAPPDPFERRCGAEGHYEDGVGTFHSWCM